MLSNLAGTLILSKEYKNNDHESFDEVFALFLKEAGLSNEPPLTACIAVAGPVKDNMVRFTNRDGWIIAGRHIEEKFQIKSVQLVNDFLAAGYGLLTLNESTECVVLQEGTKNPSAPIACIGAGTGLGECFLTPKSQGEYTCYPSEGGHAEFAPRNEVGALYLFAASATTLFGLPRRLCVRLTPEAAHIASLNFSLPTA